MNKIERANGGTNSKGSNQKTYINAGAINNAFDVFNYAENAEKRQVICDKCKPTISKSHDATKLCANCEAERQETANTFFDNFRRHRKIIKLDCYCFACNSPKSKTMMSKILPICRGCAGELKSKSATAQSNLIARTLNNFHKKLKGAMV